MSYIPPNPNGQATAANSAPVVLASDQTLPLPTGASTSANQTTTNSSLSTIATNTGNAATVANQTNGNQQTKITNGTNIADVVAGDSGLNGVATTSATKTVNFSVSSTGIVTGFPVACGAYTWVSVQFTSVGVGLSISPQFSLNNTDFVTPNGFWTSANSTTAAGGIAAAIGTIFEGPIIGDSFQLNITALTSGTVAGVVKFFTLPRSVRTMGISAAQNGTWNVTNVSGTVSLPTGASTAAKQPALGTAGTASADVLTVQGITSMTPLKVDGSGVTQPVSGTFWQATQPVSLATNTPTLQSGSTTAVTQATAASLNATVVGTGTFAAQATLQTQTDTVMVGGINIKEINAVAPLMGNGVTGTGSQRVTIASDNTAFSVNAVESGTWTVGSNSATGSVVPANAFYLGVNDFGTGNLVGIRGTANATNSSGAGVLASGIMGQFDDVSPTAITENNFGNVRISANRNLYGTVRDAAGNERGANVNASNQLTVAATIDQTTPGTTNAVVDTPVTSGGLLIVTGSVGATATAIKASAGQLYGYHLFNTTAAVAYVQIFNVAFGSVTLGTTTPTISVGIPASGGATVNFDKGIAFGTAMSFACTTTRTGLTGATCDVNFFYK